MSQLGLSGGALLLILGLAPSIAGQAMRSTVGPEPESCRFRESLTVHVLFDNTTTVRDSVPQVWENLDGWLRALERSLRPEDRIEIFRLAYNSTNPRALEQAPFAITVRESADRIPEVVEWMRGDEATKTDLADALEHFRKERRHAQACGEVLLLVTDGSLDPRDTAQGPQGAIDRLTDAVGALRESGWSVFAVQVDDRNPRAFDNHFRRRVAESTRRMIDQEALSASEMLGRTFGPSNVISWKRHEKIAAFLYEREESPFVRHRDLVWARPGLTLRDLTRSGVTNVLYAQTDEDGSDAYRGCSARDERSDDHVVLGPAHACYHLLDAPDDSLLERLADGVVGRFGWRAEPDLRLEYSGRLVHPAQFRVVTSAQGGTACGADEVPFESASAAGGSEIVVVTVRFVRGPSPVWTDTMRALDRSDCFLLWDPNPVDARLTQRPEDTLYVRFEHYLGSTLVERAHHFVVGRMIPLEWRGQVTSLLPFFALRLERWYVRASIPLPTWVEAAQLKLEGQPFYLERVAGSCPEESHTIACFRFDSPTHERALPQFGTIALTSALTRDANIDCRDSGASCVTLPVRESGLARKALFAGDAVIDLILFGGCCFCLFIVLWDPFKLRGREQGQGVVVLLRRALQVSGCCTAIVIVSAEFYFWSRRTDQFVDVGWVALGGSVLVLGLVVPVFCDVAGDITNVWREWAAAKSVPMTQVAFGAMWSSYIALGIVGAGKGILPLRLFFPVTVAVFARPLAAGLVKMWHRIPDRAQVPVREAEPVASAEAPAQPAPLSSEAAGTPDESLGQLRTKSGESRGAGPSHSESDGRILPVHNATLGGGPSTGGVHPDDPGDVSLDAEAHVASVAGEQAAPSGSFAAQDMNGLEGADVQQVSLSEEELRF
jgi:hypothetical protein